MDSIGEILYEGLIVCIQHYRQGNNKVDTYIRFRGCSCRCMYTCKDRYMYVSTYKHRSIDKSG